jgi:hypothetical protein
MPITNCSFKDCTNQRTETSAIWPEEIIAFVTDVPTAESIISGPGVRPLANVVASILGQLAGGLAAEYEG